MKNKSEVRFCEECGDAYVAMDSVFCDKCKKRIMAQNFSVMANQSQMDSTGWKDSVQV